MGVVSAESAYAIYTGFRCCKHCYAAYYKGDGPGYGSCPSSNKVHEPTKGMAYKINGKGANGADGWKLCNSCGCVFFRGTSAINKSKCNSGGSHTAVAEVEFVLPGRGGNAGTTWCWCSKCQTLFNYDFEDNGACPKGGEHDATGSSIYYLKDYTP